MRFLTRLATFVIVGGLIAVGVQYVRHQAHPPVEPRTDASPIDRAADAIEQGGDAVLPAIRDLAQKAMDSQIAADVRAKALDLALDAAQTDEQKNALLIACLELAGDPSDSDLQKKALAIIGKLSLNAAEDIGRKLVAIASDEKNQEAIKKAAFQALENLDVPDLKAEIEKLAERFR